MMSSVSNVKCSWMSAGSARAVVAVMRMWAGRELLSMRAATFCKGWGEGGGEGEGEGGHEGWGWQ